MSASWSSSAEPGRLSSASPQAADGVQGVPPPPRPRAATAHHFGAGLVVDILQAAALEQRCQLAPKERVIAPSRKPPPGLVDPVVAGIQRMGGIHRAGGAPVAVFVDEPAARAQASHHLLDRPFLPAGQPEQHQPRTDEVKRSRIEIIDGIVQDVVPPHHQIGHIRRARYPRRCRSPRRDRSGPPARPARQPSTPGRRRPRGSASPASPAGAADGSPDRKGARVVLAARLRLPRGPLAAKRYPGYASSVDSTRGSSTIVIARLSRKGGTPIVRYRATFVA